MWACAILACLSLVALNSYYRQEDFLNKGYLLPLERIADIIQGASSGRSAQLIVDAPGLDVSPLTGRLNITATQRPDVIWVLTTRNGGAPPAGAREIWREQFVPYSGLTSRHEGPHWKCSRVRPRIKRISDRVTGIWLRLPLSPSSAELACRVQ
jgi:hypothetical protein